MMEDWSSDDDSKDDTKYEELDHETAASEESDGEDIDQFLMHVAIEKNSIQLVRELIAQRNERKKVYDDALTRGKEMIAKDGGDVETFEKSFGQFNDPLNERDVDGVSPLQFACLFRNFEIFQLLVDSGADLSKKLGFDSLMHLILNIASVRNEKNIEFTSKALDYILARDAPLLHVDDLSRNIFTLCAELKLTAELKKIVEKVKTMDRSTFPVEVFFLQDHFKRDCFMNCAASGAAEEFQMLLGLVESLGDWGIEKLKESILTNVDYEGKTCKLIASERGHNEIVAMIKSKFEASEVNGVVARAPERLKTLILTHDIFWEHLTIEKDKSTSVKYKMLVPCENVNRLEVILNKELGSLYTSKFENKTVHGVGRKAEMADILRVHEYSYVQKLKAFCQTIPEGGSKSLDGDTSISRDSYEAALYAAGTVCQAIDLIVERSDATNTAGAKRSRSADGVTSSHGAVENIFCAVRPPGHHAGSTGVVSDEPDSGSYGFCLLNNVAIGAAYARHVHRDTVRKVAIIDFDVHHGNGTEECVRNLIPHTKSIVLNNSALREPILRQHSSMKYDIKREFDSEVKAQRDLHLNLMNAHAAFSEISIKEEVYRPWLNTSDSSDIFFVSIHGFGRRFPQMNSLPVDVQSSRLGSFYPSSGATYVNLVDGSSEETSSTEEDIQLNHHAYEPNILNFGQKTDDAEEWRGYWKKIVLPQLHKFRPDLILISAGFDAHKRDEINAGYIGVQESDYYWLTKELVKIANTTCDGRVVSILEGGYNIAGGIVSPFARSVSAHVAALAETNRREKYEPVSITKLDKMEKSE